MRSSFPSLHRRLLGLRGGLALALLLSALAPAASLGGVARAQEPPLVPKSPGGAAFVLGDPAPAIAAYPDRDLQLELGADLRRAKRTARAGGFLVGIGALGGVASTIALYRSNQVICPIEDLFCDNTWMRGMASASGIVASAGVATVGLVTLSIGIARRNRLEGPARSVALGAGPGTLDLRVSF